MKIKLVSDLHVDCQKDSGISLIRDISCKDHDVLVIAGDLCQVSDLDLFDDTWEMLSLKFKKIIYVNGNHEFWDGNPWTTDETIDEVLAQYNNVIRLKTGEAHTIDGHRFIGGTMWFRDSGRIDLQKRFSDFEMIHNFRSYVFKENEKFIEMFKNGFAKKNDIVVTHHVPSLQLIHKMYLNDPINQFFYCEMMEDIKRVKPVAWLFGHTHKQSNQMLNNTWFVANPHGYPLEMSNMGFDENLVLEIIV